MKALKAWKRKLSRKFPNIYLVLIGLLFGGAGMAVAFYVVAKGTPAVVESDYASISAARKMKRSIAAWKHPEDYDNQDTEHFINEFDTGLVAAKNMADQPSEVATLNRVGEIWARNRNHPTAMSAEDSHALKKELDNFVKSNEGQMTDRVIQSNRISKLVMGFGFIFFAMAWFI
jgi:hypothetical protein